MLKRKKDTLVLDVRKMEELRYTSPAIVMNYIGVFVTGDITIGLLATGVGSEPVFAVIPALLTFLLIKDAHRKLDTRTKWSFY